MSEFFLHYYAYWFIILVLMIGLFAMLFKRNLVKQLIGMNIFQVAIILFWVASASKRDGTVPVIDPAIGPVAEAYMNPLPHTLMLTAIVVSVGVIGVGVALLIAIYREFGTLDEPELLERMK